MSNYIDYNLKAFFEFKEDALPVMLIVGKVTAHLRRV
jgi:hypothetical protein